MQLSEIGSSGNGLLVGQDSAQWLSVYLWAVSLLSELHTYINLIASLEESSQHTHSYVHTHIHTHRHTHAQERTYTHTLVSVVDFCFNVKL